MLSIVIPVHDAVERLRVTLRTVVAGVRNEHQDTEIIVVNDGGSADVRACVEQMSSAQTRVTHLAIPHGGRSAARNAGAWQARGERVLFLDGDVLVERGTLRVHATIGGRGAGAFVRGTILDLPGLAILRDPALGTLTDRARQSFAHDEARATRLAAARRIQLDEDGFPDARVRASSRCTRFEHDLHVWLEARVSQASLRWIGSTGGHLSVPRDTFERLGGFDEQMGRQWGAEDLELGYRAECAGVTVHHAPDAIVYHMAHETVARAADHDAALGYFATKHRNPRIMRLQEYFFGNATLEEVLA